MMALTLEPLPSTSAEKPAPPRADAQRAHIADGPPPSKKSTSKGPRTTAQSKSKPSDPRRVQPARTVRRNHTTTNASSTLLPLHQQDLPTPTPALLIARPLTEEPDPSTTPAHVSLLGDVATEQMKHLESLLDSVLATLVIVQSATTLPLALSTHSRHALTVLNHLVAPTPTVTTCNSQTPLANLSACTKPSYASAATTTPAMPVALTAKPSPAGQLPQKHPRTHKPSTPHNSPHRLIVRWHDHPVPQSSQSLEPFLEHLNESIDYAERSAPGAPRSRPGTQPTKIAGCNITKAGNIILYTRAPTQASSIIEHLTDSNHLAIRQAATYIPKFDDPGCDASLSVDVDAPWSGYVVHDIPATPLTKALDDSSVFWRELEAKSGLQGKDVRDLRILCRDEEKGAKEHLSIRLMLDNPHLLDHLRRDGMFLFGTHCRVSRYHPRKSRCPPLPNPDPPIHEDAD